MKHEELIGNIQWGLFEHHIYDKIIWHVFSSCDESNHNNKILLNWQYFNLIVIIGEI